VLTLLTKHKLFLFNKRRRQGVLRGDGASFKFLSLKMGGAEAVAVSSFALRDSGVTMWLVTRKWWRVESLG